MNSSPVICFGQQPCGFFPKRFLVAKIQTARRLQQAIGGKIVFFYHDSDHDPRETQTILRHRKTGEPAKLNFGFVGKIQRKFSPCYLKRMEPGWQMKTERQLPNYVSSDCAQLFQSVSASNIAEFCLAMYQRLGLLEGIEVARSSDPALRCAACDVEDFFVDAPYQGEIVRARYVDGLFQLHEGGDSFVTWPASTFSKEQISPARDTRLRWMQSVLHCTHYVAGAGEKAYLRESDAPDIEFINRDPIDRSDEAYTDISH